jgi:transcriptional regulator with XRE-family HTH domain
MITRIREVRRARGMTLDDVARACRPATTPQTIGRLETGTRTVSLGWLNRIAAALGVEAQDLVKAADTAELKVAAVLGPAGAAAPKRAALVVAPRISDGQVAVTVSGSVGEYRTGDEIWCETLAPEDFGRGLNRDVLVPRPAGRFLFARLIDRADDKLQLLPLGAGGRQQIVANPPWIAVATKLIRSL